MAAIGAVFGAVLLALSFVTGTVGLTAGFVGIRMAGQGALTLVAITTVAYWFDRRRGLALGITSAVGTAGISLAPLLVERLIADIGRRQASAVEGIAVWDDADRRAAGVSARGALLAVGGRALTSPPRLSIGASRSTTGQGVLACGAARLAAFLHAASGGRVCSGGWRCVQPAGC